MMGNLATVEQGVGDGTNTAFVGQENGGNTVLLDQRGGGTNIATINQRGNGNGVYGLGGIGSAAFQNSTAGDPNVLTITQQAGGGTTYIAFVSQEGAGNVAVISQGVAVP